MNTRTLAALIALSVFFFTVPGAQTANNQPTWIIKTAKNGARIFTRPLNGGVCEFNYNPRNKSVVIGVLNFTTAITTVKVRRLQKIFRGKLSKRKIYTVKTTPVNAQNVDKSATDRLYDDCVEKAKDLPQEVQAAFGGIYGIDQTF